MPSSSAHSPLIEDRSMTKHRSNLLQILTAVQNCTKFEHQDIMTFAGFMSDAELPEYVWQRFALLPAGDKAAVLEVARSVMEL
jgi:hypothetical protein